MIFTNNFNDLVLQEAGLEVDSNQNVVDQDTGMQIEFSGHPLKYSKEEIPLNKGDIMFDPLNNVKQMQSIFKYSMDKTQKESDLYVQTFFTKPLTEDKTVLALKAKHTDAESTQQGFVELNSKPYNNESLKYADVLLQVNGDEDVDLSQFDSEEDPYKNRKR